MHYFYAVFMLLRVLSAFSLPLNGTKNKTATCMIARFILTKIVMFQTELNLGCPAPKPPATHVHSSVSWLNSQSGNFSGFIRVRRTHLQSFTAAQILVKGHKNPSSWAGCRNFLWLKKRTFGPFKGSNKAGDAVMIFFFLENWNVVF